MYGVVTLLFFFSLDSACLKYFVTLMPKCCIRFGQHCKLGPVRPKLQLNGFLQVCAFLYRYYKG